MRGWAAGTLAAMDYTGAGVASLCFAVVTILPGHWRALYVIGGMSLFFVAFLRRRLPETKRFQVRHEQVAEAACSASAARSTWRGAYRANIPAASR